jgi:hypothetical protein
MAKGKAPSKSAPTRKRRRHGYRGYGSPLHKEPGGVIHYPRGFTGVEFPGQGVDVPSRPEAIPEELPEDELPEESPKK